jgi:hypothetical protein
MIREHLRSSASSGCVAIVQAVLPAFVGSASAAGGEEHSYLLYCEPMNHAEVLVAEESSKTKGVEFAAIHYPIHLQEMANSVKN